MTSASSAAHLALRPVRADSIRTGSERKISCGIAPWLGSLQLLRKDVYSLRFCRHNEFENAHVRVIRLAGGAESSSVQYGRERFYRREPPSLRRMKKSTESFPGPWQSVTSSNSAQ